MPIDTGQLTTIIEQLLKRIPARKNGLTTLEKLAVECIAQNRTYRHASLLYQYTESSFQNAASRLFRDLSQIINTPINRRNFVEVLEAAWTTVQATEKNSLIVFEHLKANFWIRAEQAQLILIGYQANQVLDVSHYLLDYSSRFAATFCLNVNPKSSPLELLWSLCHSLQISLPIPKNDPAALLHLITTVLTQQSTLLVLRFDQLPLDVGHLACREYAEILAALSLGENQSCLVVLDHDAGSQETALQKSLAYELRLIISERIAKHQNAPLRLISIENDQQSICDLLQTYLQ